MLCPKCGYSTKVIDSRDVEDGKETRRRRECEKCKYRFTTYEKLTITKFMVIKSNGDKVLFDRNKLEKSIIKAINKTDIDI
jgi:transcriptional repressor NrdR